MTFYRDLYLSEFIEKNRYNRLKLVYESRNGKIDFLVIRHISDIYFFKIQCMNLLLHHSNLFCVYNQNENMFELPIGDGYILTKEYSYDVYEEDEMIMRIHPGLELEFMKDIRITV